jgi:hypothetical protein
VDLSHEFEVTLPIEEAWSVLTDLGRIAPCMPGAQIDEIADDEYRGRVRVKVGPITAEYKGVAHFLSRDASNHVAELRAEGRETRGQGSAAATVRAVLTEQANGKTSVSVETALDISGRVAQFGRGALAEVSSKLLGQFVDNLERDLAERPAPATDADAATTNGAGPDAIRPDAIRPDAIRPDAIRPDAGEGAGTSSGPANVEPVRALGVIGPVLLKRLIPVGAVVGLWAVLRRFVRHRRGTDGDMNEPSLP